MRRFLIRVIQVSAIAMLGTGVLADASFAEKFVEARAKVSQLCATAGGIFYDRVDGYVCLYALSDGFRTTKECSTFEVCEWVQYCPGGQRCDFGKPIAAKKDPPKRPKPTKRQEDGSTIIIDDHGLGPKNGGTISGAVSNGTLSAAAPSPTASPKPAPSPTVANSPGTNSTAPKSSTTKPPSIWNGAALWIRRPAQ